jgi:hypothetical protein
MQFIAEGAFRSRPVRHVLTAVASPARPTVA